jgi:uncharacterized protein (TIGR00295 family)
MPDLEPRRAWARLTAAKPPEWVPRHCRCVAALAAAMCDCAEDAGLAIDRHVVVQAALLHDIGRSLTQDVHHASVGADLLRKDGPDVWDERVILCVERHTGAGIDKAEAKTLGLPVKDYTPKSLEEKIVAHADNLPTAAAKIRLLHDELEDLLEVDLEDLEPAILDLS